MKKLIAIAVVLALVAGVAFAADGIEINAWGRGAFAPIKYIGPEQVNGETKKVNGENVEGETYTGVGPTWGVGQSWSNSKARVDFRIAGVSDYVGFKFHAAAENDSLSTNDEGAHIWAKPFGSDILKVTVGMFIDDTLRGKIGQFAGGFENFVLPTIINGVEEDAIFKRFGCSHDTFSVHGSAPAGFMISSAPVDGLFLGLMVRGGLDGNDITEAALAYQYMQFGVGYNIANIGHVRAQYIGGWSGTHNPDSKDDFKYWQGNTTDLADIGLAFALTAVQGLLIDVGTRIGLPLEVKDAGKYSNGMDFAVAASFNSGAFGIGARMDIQGIGAYSRVDDKDAREKATTTVIRVVPTFELGEVTLGLDVGFALLGKSKDYNGDVEKSSGGSQLGFGAFVSKGLGKGNIRAGLSYTLPPNTGEDNKANGSAVFQLPIILEYAFF